MTRHLGSLVLAAAATAFGLAGSPAGAQTHAQVGRLTCNLAPSVGLIVGSRQRMTCTFLPNGPGPREVYAGTITRAGLDVGFTAGGRMVWGVYSRVAGPRPGALAGTYLGASGDIAIGLGVGANALVGGSNRSVALQPPSKLRPESTSRWALPVCDS
jgi:Protein of unknown function (DUF992)